MKPETITDVSVEIVKEESAHIAYRRPYAPPQIIRLNDVNVESGITTHLVETSGGVWNAGS